MSRTLDGLALATLLLTASPAAASHGTPPTCGSQGTPINCNPYFDYFGGQTISNVKLYAVFWDNTVSHDVVANIPDFYKALANSEYLDWLNEYSTTIAANAGSHNQQQGTGQVVGRGTFAGGITLPSLSMTYPACPAPATSRTCITDAQIQSELKWQVAQGRLPAPDPYTLYMVHLPAAVIIYDPGGVGLSCQTFCAYHDTTTSGNQNLYYAVIPALDSRGCRRGCGMGTLLQNTAASASHEIAEAITDAQVGQASHQRLDYPLGWYDAASPSMGEIGDLCEGLTDTLGDDGLRGCQAGTAGCYTVQPVFSNALWTANLGALDTPACVATRYADAGDYSLALAPNTVQVPAGASSPGIPVVTLLTSTTDPAAPMPVTLSVTDSPPGVHASFDRSSIDAGETATLTVSVDPGAAPVKDGVLVVQATGSQNHSAALLVQVTAQEQALPAISIAAPAAGAVLKGSAPVEVVATAGSSAIASITILADGATLSSGTATSTVWNTTGVADGDHSLIATVVDAEGAAVSASAKVTVKNAVKKVVTAILTTPSAHRSGCSAAGGTGAMGLLLVGAALLRRR